MRLPITFDDDKLADFCRRWKVSELAAFGSVLREDFRADSDIDMIVGFSPDADWSLLEHIAMQDELTAILGRRVDLVTRRAVERSRNWIRRKAILESVQPVYVAR